MWPVTVRIDGDVAYAWVERLEKPKTRWATFYSIAFKGGKATVTSTMGYNTEIMQNNFGYSESRNKVFDDDWSKHPFGVDVRAAALKLPFKCERAFESDTPAKLATIDFNSEVRSKDPSVRKERCPPSGAREDRDCELQRR